MAGNASLVSAKAAKNDEFYTQWNDIENEMQAYLEYDPDAFRGKTILLPCDDPDWSNFTKYFAERFEQLGLKKLISTSCAADGGNGKVFMLEGENGPQQGHLSGDGDFRSDEVIALRGEADMVVTNPPYSLFREFVSWLVEGDVEFAVIGNFNSIACKEIFPLIKDNKMWLGQPVPRGSMWFTIPDNMVDSISKRDKTCFRVEDGQAQARRPACWFTNIEHGRRHEPLLLMTMEDNLVHGSKKVRGAGYPHYDNYGAIEVPETKGIPSDYPDVMGVPISFLDKYSPDQFEIIGIAKRGAGDPALKTRVYTAGDYPNYSDLNAAPVIIENDTPRIIYTRILIRHRNPERKETQSLSRSRGGRSSMRCKRGFSHVKVRG